MLRCETRVRHGSLLVATGVAFGGIGLGALLVAGAVPRRSVVCVPVPVPVAIPTSTPPPVAAAPPPPALPSGPRTLDEPITTIAVRRRRTRLLVTPGMRGRAWALGVPAGSRGRSLDRRP